MKKLVILTAGLVIPFVLPVTSSAAEQEPIVIEDLSRRELRAEVEKIQNEIYRVFNQLNEDDNFDIICHVYVPTGSNIANEACEPKFMIDRRGKNSQDYHAGTDELLSSDALRRDLHSEFEQLTVKMNEVAAKSEYFRELNQIVAMLRARQQELGN
jgi:hypothetical protein